MGEEKIYDQESENQELEDMSTEQANGAAKGRRANMSEEELEGNDISAGLAGEEYAGEQSTENEWKDKYLRLSAEFDNYRKRTLKEKMDIIESGGEKVISSLLPVLDDMDRAIEAMNSAEDGEAIRQGVELIERKLKDTLRMHGLAEIDAAGKELDTDFHEAVAKIPAQKKSERGRIVDVVQKGYTLKDKVIRHAKVVVGE